MRAVVAVLAILMLTPAWADDGTLDLSVMYKGGDQFTFEKKDYGSYGELLTAIRAKYGSQHITTIQVHMGKLSSVEDTLKVCRLKHDTGAFITMHFMADGQKNQLYCN